MERAATPETGTKNKDMKLNADVSVTIYVQSDAPAERTNWLPSPKGADFSLYVRTYWPKQAAIDGHGIPRQLRNNNKSSG